MRTRLAIALVSVFVTSYFVVADVIGMMHGEFNPLPAYLHLLLLFAALAIGTLLARRLEDDEARQRHEADQLRNPGTGHAAGPMRRTLQVQPPAPQQNAGISDVSEPTES